MAYVAFLAERRLRLAAGRGAAAAAPGTAAVAPVVAAAASGPEDVILDAGDGDAEGVGSGEEDAARGMGCSMSLEE